MEQLSRYSTCCAQYRQNYAYIHMYCLCTIELIITQIRIIIFGRPKKLSYHCENDKHFRYDGSQVAHQTAEAASGFESSLEAIRLILYISGTSLWGK